MGGKAKDVEVVIKEFIWPHVARRSDDFKAASDRFEDSQNELAVNKKLNGNPFIVRFLGGTSSQTANADGTVDFNVAIFLAKATGTLEDRAKKGPLDTAKETRKMLAQMFLGVAVMHWKGYLHRDLKPGQFLIGEDKVLRLADFGTAIQNSKEKIYRDTLNRIDSAKAKGRLQGVVAMPSKNKAGKRPTNVFGNLLYRSPESLLFMEINDLRRNVVDMIASVIVFNFCRNKGITEQRKCKSYNFKNADYDQMEAEAKPMIKKALKGIDAQLGALKANGYSKPMDYWAMGMTLWDLYTGMGTARSIGPYPISGIMQLKVDLTADIDLSALDTSVTDAAVRPLLKDLIGKLLDKNPRTRLQDAGEVLAHPFFASAGVDLAELIALGVKAMNDDNKAVGSLGVRPQLAAKTYDVGVENVATRTQGDEDLDQVAESLDLNPKGNKGFEDGPGSDLPLMAADPRAARAIAEANKFFKANGINQDVTKMGKTVTMDGADSEDGVGEGGQGGDDEGGDGEGGDGEGGDGEGGEDDGENGSTNGAYPDLFGVGPVGGPMRKPRPKPAKPVDPVESGEGDEDE
ncbi:kinase-like domain-containing protein [Hyaloraphidium curvatum]|nr:kinase-like domain-containing protein [Hyaloraphidium curvatum]